MSGKNKLDELIVGSFYSDFFRELLTNSAHFPIINIVLEALKEGPKNYFSEADPYVLIIAALSQSLIIVYINFKNKKLSPLANLIGPTIYALFEIVVENGNFFEAPQHNAYCIFAVSIMFFQFLKNSNNHLFKFLIEVIENIVRTLIPLVMYILFEANQVKFLNFLPNFFSDTAHVFLAFVIFFLGCLIGFSQAQNSSAKEKLKILALKLKQFSSWSFGEKLLNEAVKDESILTIKRVERSILFFDIRGFTRWSESKSPEEVIEMLNAYYKAAENVLNQFSILKMKFTADEIMAVFEQIDQSAKAGLELKKDLNDFLKNYDLKVGGGIHFGPVVEGLIGSDDHRFFDVMGDTVNTAKRLCETASGEEILVSLNFLNVSEGKAYTIETREVSLKGKENKQQVFPLINYF